MLVLIEVSLEMVRGGFHLFTPTTKIVKVRQTDLPSAVERSGSRRNHDRWNEGHFTRLDSGEKGEERKIVLFNGGERGAPRPSCAKAVQCSSAVN